MFNFSFQGFNHHSTDILQEKGEDCVKDESFEHDIKPSKPNFKKAPIVNIRPGRPQIIDLSNIVQFRPRPTPPTLRIPFLISREELEKRRKTLLQWSITAKLKI